MLARTTDLEAGIRPAALYSSKIIKAGALIGDTKTLLAHWDTEASVAENLSRAQRENVFGKASRSRVAAILAIFRQRYCIEVSVTKALVILLQKNMPTDALTRLFYFHSARADQLLNDSVIEVLTPMQERGAAEIGLHEIQRALTKWVIEGRTIANWSESTIARIARGLLSALRDFGVLRGAVKKKIASPYLPIESFAYLVFYMKQRQPSGAKLIELPEWKLFFLQREDVEKLLFEAHQRDLLEYHVAGSVTRLTFRAKTLEEYANVLVKG